MTCSSRGQIQSRCKYFVLVPIATCDPYCDNCATRDQRGGVRVANGRIDIGAHEAYPDAPLPEIISVSQAGSSQSYVIVESEPSTFWRLEKSQDLKEFELEQIFLAEPDGENWFLHDLPDRYIGSRYFYRIVRP